ncbi:hypothetical protein [Sphingopyxis kveilinensis]|uniref:hypothetical protein n=1 Tax=Sphingopyxis kveilinensis TaxID=3114367 RepID=UPI0030D4979C
MMIARRWSGMVLREQSAEYLRLMREVAIPDYRAIDGNLAAMCLHSARGQVVEVTMLTFWRDMDAIAAFAGAEPTIAKYYDFDSDFLLWQAREVEHFAVDAADFAADFN